MFSSGYNSHSVCARIRTSSNKRYKSLQGIYRPRVGGPYRGPMKNPKFRSKIELRLMTMLDNASNVVSWTYESKRIPYVDRSTTILTDGGLRQNPTRNYVIDFIVTVNTSGGVPMTFWIETKSIHDIMVNKTNRKTKNAAISEQIRVKNYSKWIAASKAAKACNAKFLVVTENELERLNSIIHC